MWILLVKWFSKDKKKLCLNIELVSCSLLCSQTPKSCSLLHMCSYELFTEKLFNPCVAKQKPFFFFFFFLTLFILYMHLFTHLSSIFIWTTKLLCVIVCLNLLSVSSYIWMNILCGKLKLKLQDRYLDIQEISVCIILDI